jgi:hypothetical protein
MKSPSPVRFLPRRDYKRSYEAVYAILSALSDGCGFTATPHVLYQKPRGPVRTICKPCSCPSILRNNRRSDHVSHDYDRSASSETIQISPVSKEICSSIASDLST